VVRRAPKDGRSDIFTSPRTNFAIEAGAGSSPKEVRHIRPSCFGCTYSIFVGYLLTSECSNKQNAATCVIIEAGT
jgi:hypothetical protein